jgi:hypothetical protein
MRRARAYEREGQAHIPGVVETALGALRPSSIPHKTLRAEAFRSMKLLKHQSGYAQYKLRLVTTVRGGALRTALEIPLRKAGWLGAQQTLRTPLERPDGRVLEVNLKEPDEMPSTIDLILTTRDGSSPMETPSLLLAKPPLWPTLLGESTLIGYEFGHFHGTRAGASYTDIERIAVIYRTKAPKRLVRTVRRTLLAGDFELDDDGTVLRGADGVSLVFKADPDNGHVLVHSQRRWAQPNGSALPEKSTSERSTAVTPAKAGTRPSTQRPGKPTPVAPK